MYNLSVAESDHTYHQQKIGGSTTRLWPHTPYLYYSCIYIKMTMDHNNWGPNMFKNNYSHAIV